MSMLILESPIRDPLTPPPAFRRRISCRCFHYRVFFDDIDLGWYERLSESAT